MSRFRKWGEICTLNIIDWNLQDRFFLIIGFNINGCISESLIYSKFIWFICISTCTYIDFNVNITVLIIINKIRIFYWQINENPSKLSPAAPSSFGFTPNRSGPTRTTSTRAPCCLRGRSGESAAAGSSGEGSGAAAGSRPLSDLENVLQSIKCCAVVRQCSGAGAASSSFWGASVSVLTSKIIFGIKI